MKCMTICCFSATGSLSQPLCQVKHRANVQTSMGWGTRAQLSSCVVDCDWVANRLDLLALKLVLFTDASHTIRVPNARALSGWRTTKISKNVAFDSQRRIRIEVLEGGVFPEPWVRENSEWSQFPLQPCIVHTVHSFCIGITENTSQRSVVCSLTTVERKGAKQIFLIQAPFCPFRFRSPRQKKIAEKFHRQCLRQTHEGLSSWAREMNRVLTLSQPDSLKFCIEGVGRGVYHQQIFARLLKQIGYAKKRCQLYETPWFPSCAFAVDAEIITQGETVTFSWHTQCAQW